LAILHHKIYGEGEPLFILHGLFGSLDNWNTLGRRLSENRKVILVDQRNHGRSFHDDEMTYDAMADDLRELMDHLEISKSDLLGHSMGGKTVMRAALRFPDRVNRLLVADIGPWDYPSHHDKILEALSSVDLDELESRSEAQKVLSDHIEQKGVVLFLAKNLFWKEKGQLGWRMNLPVIAENMENILASIGEESYDGKTVFIRGGRSDYIQDDTLMALHMQFINSKVLTIDEAGHWLHAEKAEEFFTIVREFLIDSAL
jgi:pimeloyl-ACP methyl ester carboxylesterase